MFKEQIQKSKLETLKDMATAVGGTMSNLISVAGRCEKELGKDYGIRDVITFLAVVHADMKQDIDTMESAI